jgi:esterase/lipase superfamily enzyme
MATAWTRKNQPLLASLVNQLIMVAADVDNDVFEPLSSDTTDGNAVANLTYRITALFSGRDAVLGASAGLKHFGSRRLGRSGLPVEPPTGKDNIWDIDCSGFFPKERRRSRRLLRPLRHNSAHAGNFARQRPWRAPDTWINDGHAVAVTENVVNATPTIDTRI